MKTLSEIVERIKEEIPSDFKNKEELLGALAKIMDDSLYTAPENMHLHFAKTGEALEQYLGVPDVAWKKNVVKIFSDEN